MKERNFKALSDRMATFACVPAAELWTLVQAG